MADTQGIIKIPELKKRIFFTFLMIVVYRIGVHIPTPGVDGVALQSVFGRMQGTLFGVFNLFNGGALERFSIFALGVMPYITSSIIFQLLTFNWSYLSDLQKEGDQGRKKITQYTRYGAIFFCLIHGFGLAAGLEHYHQPDVVFHPGWPFRLMTTCTLTAGTIFLMWLGEQISERGIGNGISLIIYAGIAARIPQGIGNTLNLYRSGEISLLKIVAILAIIFLTFFFIIFVEKAARKIPIHYAKRIVGRKMYGGQNTHLPLKVNTSGVLPPIFASSLIMFPATLATIFPFEKIQKIGQLIQPGSFLYNVLFVLLIVFFCFFYTAVAFKTDDITDNLKKYGGFIPGIRPGAMTAEYIDYVLSRITVAGAVYISLVCVLPNFLTQSFHVPFYFGGTSVLILVGVALDTAAQVESFLVTRNYDSFMKQGRSKRKKMGLSS